MLAGKAGAARQKRPVDFSTFLKHADAPEPKKQPTSFSSFLRHAMLDSPDDVNCSLLTGPIRICGASKVLLTSVVLQQPFPPTAAMECKL